MILAHDLKEKAREAGFAMVGISNPEVLRGLRCGEIENVTVLKTPEDELHAVRSVVLMGIYAWDQVFNVVVDSTRLRSDGSTASKMPSESYQLYYEIAEKKAWKIAHYLEKKGFDSVPSFSIPLKTTAVKCGLGCQRKNTLLISPRHGPRVRLVSILTAAELDVDEPYKDDLCKNCERCMFQKRQEHWKQNS